jgi:1-acyl-sn-glycerol-3-phosphate acyltransferase
VNTLKRIAHNLRSIYRVWRLAQAAQAGEPKRPKAERYRMPRQWMLAMGHDLLLKRPRSIVTDSALAVRSLPRSPVVEGLEHLPSSGSFILATNHCQRKDLWIGWAISLLIDSINRQRQDHPVPHVVATDRAVFDGFTVPGSRWLFERVALAWNLVLVTPPEVGRHEPAGSRRSALRQCLNLLQRQGDRAVYFALAPEGLAGTARGLGEAVPGSGRSLLALAGHGLPIVPAVVWEEAPGKLHARFGPIWHPVPPPAVRENRAALDAWGREQMMRRLAALLPAALRGRYEPLEAGRSYGALDASNTGAAL